MPEGVMSFPPRFVVLLDGGFVIRNLRNRFRRFPTADDVVHLCESIGNHPELKHLDLLRAYFYHAPPATGKIVNPLSGEKTDLSTTETHRRHRQLLDELELRRDFAVRLGNIVTSGWRLGSQARKNLVRQQRAIEGRDLVPHILQKGVDLRIGLDIARLALGRMVSVIVVVTGDSDMVPAFKFARREGIRVYLEHLGHPVMRELKVHADRVLDIGI